MTPVSSARGSTASEFQSTGALASPSESQFRGHEFALGMHGKKRDHVENLYAKTNIKIDSDISADKRCFVGVKLNVHSSIKGNKRQVYGWVLRDSNGDPFYLQVKQISRRDMGGKKSNNNVVELYALCKKIVEVVPLIDKEYKYLVIHGDNSNSIVDLKDGKRSYTFNNNLVKEAAIVLDRLEKEGKVVIVEYVPRHINMLADYITGKWVKGGIYDGRKDQKAIKKKPGRFFPVICDFFLGFSGPVGGPDHCWIEWTGQTDRFLNHSFELMFGSLSDPYKESSSSSSSRCSLRVFRKQTGGDSRKRKQMGPSKYSAV